MDDYLPQLHDLVLGVSHDELGVQGELSKRLFPTVCNSKADQQDFSWRTTLTPSLLTSNRLSFTGLHADLVFTLLVQGYTLSNYAHTLVQTLGTYEYDPSLPDKDRAEKETTLNFAVDLLKRASGVFTHIADVVMPEWDNSQFSYAASSSSSIGSLLQEAGNRDRSYRAESRPLDPDSSSRSGEPRAYGGSA